MKEERKGRGSPSSSLAALCGADCRSDGRKRGQRSSGSREREEGGRGERNKKKLDPDHVPVAFEDEEEEGLHAAAHRPQPTPPRGHCPGHCTTSKLALLIVSGNLEINKSLRIQVKCFHPWWSRSHLKKSTVP